MWKWNPLDRVLLLLVSKHRYSFAPDNLISLRDSILQCVYWNRGHQDNENQSDGRTETTDSNIFKASQSNVQYKTMKSQLVRWLVMFARLQCRFNVKLKPVVLSCAYGFRNNYMLNSIYFRSLVNFESKSCVRLPLVIILPEFELNHCCRDGLKKALQMVCEQFH